MKYPRVDILIPNYNGREALQLCVESIAAYTAEPHRVIVYDDASTNPGDMEYLEAACNRGLVDILHFNPEHGGHGVALNSLMNDPSLDAEYAVIMDNDIQILRSGWLRDLLALADSPQVLVVCDDKAKGYWPRGFRPSMFLFWFGLINVSAYQGGMQVDWSIDSADRRIEPWLSEFADLFPPEENEIFKDYVHRGGYEEFDRNKVIFDPGCHLRNKMQFDNPKGYTFKPLTNSLRKSFHHFAHAQAWLDPANEGLEYEGPIYSRLKSEIGYALAQIRAGR
jgi:glycosyltransferase involved in cell wall biosynthesis